MVKKRKEGPEGVSGHGAGRELGVERGGKVASLTLARVPSAGLWRREEGGSDEQK